STHQSSKEDSMLKLKRQVVGKCDRSMLLATTATCRQIAEGSSSASIGQIAVVDSGLERWLSWQNFSAEVFGNYFLWKSSLHCCPTTPPLDMKVKEIIKRPNLKVEDHLTIHSNH
ncbi:hypothetical protein GBA52_007252, partial [Prunus armeniaca]